MILYHKVIMFSPSGIILYNTGIMLYPTSIILYPMGIMFYPIGIILYHTGIMLYQWVSCLYHTSPLSCCIIPKLLYPTSIMLYSTGIMLYPTGIMLYLSQEQEAPVQYTWCGCLCFNTELTSDLLLKHAPTHEFIFQTLLVEIFFSFRNRDSNLGIKPN